VGRAFLVSFKKTNKKRIDTSDLSEDGTLIPPDITYAIKLIFGELGRLILSFLTGEITSPSFERRGIGKYFRYFAFYDGAWNICSIKYPIPDYVHRLTSFGRYVVGDLQLPAPPALSYEGNGAFLVVSRAIQTCPNGTGLETGLQAKNWTY